VNDEQAVDEITTLEQWKYDIAIYIAKLQKSRDKMRVALETLIREIPKGHSIHKDRVQRHNKTCYACDRTKMVIDNARRALAETVQEQPDVDTRTR